MNLFLLQTQKIRQRKEEKKLRRQTKGKLNQSNV